MDVNKEEKEHLNILIPIGTKAKMRGYSRRNKIKNISVMARDLILKELSCEQMFGSGRRGIQEKE